MRLFSKNGLVTEQLCSVTAPAEIPSMQVKRHVRSGGHRARHPPCADSRCHRASDRAVGDPGRNLVMDLQEAGSTARFLIRDRDAKFSAAFDAVLVDAGLRILKSGARIPRMNAIMERWIQTCRRELLDRMLIWNQHHLLHALREFEAFYNEHRPHRTLHQAAPLRPLPASDTAPARITALDIHRRDRLGGILREHRHVA
ncbi:integrase core domain-containing protein [Nonomuraea solani]|uniref:integrase core domain-containing protein n=1 Tax=Nonomuraea solani TaxID=1144553 RepID=UPI0038992DE7